MCGGVAIWSFIEKYKIYFDNELHTPMSSQYYEENSCEHDLDLWINSH